MTVRLIHDGGEVFMRRALHFAMREINEQPRIVPMPATWISYLLLSRAGMSVDAIATLMDVHRKYISRRLLACFALIAEPQIRARIEALVAEMGQINFEVHEGTILRFPGPSKLLARTHATMSQ